MRMVYIKNLYLYLYIYYNKYFLRNKIMEESNLLLKICNPSVNLLLHNLKKKSLYIRYNLISFFLRIS